jgi:hypothetical protein
MCICRDFEAEPQVAAIRKCVRMCADMRPFGHSCARVPQIRGGGLISWPRVGSAGPSPPFPTAQASGSREEALSMIREAIEVYIESLLAHGDPIPGPVEIERVTVAA